MVSVGEDAVDVVFGVVGLVGGKKVSSAVEISVSMEPNIAIIGPVGIGERDGIKNPALVAAGVLRAIAESFVSSGLESAARLGLAVILK